MKNISKSSREDLLVLIEVEVDSALLPHVLQILLQLLYLRGVLLQQGFLTAALVYLRLVQDVLSSVRVVLGGVKVLNLK